MHFEDPYEILGLTPEASDEEAELACRKLSEDPEKQEEAKAALEQIWAGRSQEPAEEEPEKADEEPAEEMTEEPAEQTAQKSAEGEKPEETENVPPEEKPEGLSEEKPASQLKPGATPGKIALGVAAIVILLAVLIMLIVTALKQNDKPAEETVSGETTAQAEETAETTEATIPADGNPDDETCKGTYTVTDEELIAAADTVVATIQDHQLTNAELQIYYWMGIQSALQSNPYLAYMGLDMSKPLDSQPCPMAEGQSWQQFFLKQALMSWQNYQAMAIESELNGYELDQELLDALEKLPEDMETEAKANGFADAAALLANNVGAGSSVEDYVKFMEVYHRGYGYFADVVNAVNPSEEELEKYYSDHEAELQEGGIHKENRVASVRHILISPEDTESEESWAAAETKAKEILDTYLAGDRTSESFASLAKEHTMDPGSKETGGLYEDFAQGQMVPEFDQWSFDTSRKNGDTDIVKTEFGYHIMYYVSSRLIWQEQVTQFMAQQTASKLIEDSAAKYPMEVDYSAAVLGTLKAQ